jgi:predicted Fe-Mo cluster-binding NifX family protein
MRIVVTASGAGLDAPASPMFGRCQTYVFIDTESMTSEAVDNPAISAPGGAGIQAAQFVIEQGAEAVVTGNVGPNAYQVLQSAGVPVYLYGGGTVRQAAEAFKAGGLSAAGQASAPAHAGMGRGMGLGAGMGRGGGRGFGRTAAPQAAPRPVDATREQEIGDLKRLSSDLRGQLAEVIERLDRLEGGEE